MAVICWGIPRVGAAAPPIHFEDTVRPLLRAHCFSCHGEEADLGGGLDIRLVRHLQQGGESGPSVVPGKKADSLLYRKLKAGEMPPDGKPGLNAEQVELIGRWIDGGALTKRAEPAQFSDELLLEEARDFWSFRPLPAVRSADIVSTDSAWATGPIDTYVLQGLQHAGLSPSPRAPARVLQRRLSFALIGLPPRDDEWPSSEELSPIDYERQVDSLLASPEFGERWSRMWLDLVRYVDETPNYLSSAERAWLYRDWIIRAFNEDLPYDEFVRRQLAADQIEGLPPTELAALGLLGLSPTFWKELRLSPEVISNIVADEWDERIDTISRTFLGLSVACARCHHHKFDPVSMEDYYALAGVVASSQLAERPMLEPAAAKVVQEARRKVADWQAALTKLPQETSAVAAILRGQIETVRTETPRWNEPWAHVVEDSVLDVLPLGDDQTRLEYHPGRTRDLPLYRRGNLADPGPIVPRRFLAVLSPAAPRLMNHGSGRIDLAEALLHEAKALTARVIVNRIWAQIFGQGLVTTPSDFGRQGDPPTHPELLDYLAARLVNDAWSMKRLIQEIVLSATFQQDSLGDARSRERDPAAQLLSRMPRRRLDVEQWRDNLLALTGKLDRRLYGNAEPLDQPGFVRRTLYGRIVREELNTMLRLYDFPEASGHCPNRAPTITPLQQLFVLNSPQMLLWSTGFDLPGSDETPERRITSAYRRLFQREPTGGEVARSLHFLRQLSADNIPTASAWEAYLQVLLGANELMFVD